ncbi:MAG: RDD family protein [Reichenbachiella sp.]|uniref:RDD family protein n=1 Tax=Reichenbachiella sp. TaxID=2184521 RepID=UPI0032663CF0
MTDSSAVKYATFPQRLLAFNIDMTVFLFTVVPLFIFVENDVIFLALFFSVICIYHAVMESSSWQATLGKKYAKLKVTDGQGNRPTFYRALLRIITKYLSLLLFFMGFLMIYVRRDRRGLHDVIAKTYVVDVVNSRIS